MKRKRRTHSPEFKAKVALAAIQEDLTMAELVKKFDVYANQITAVRGLWTGQFVHGATTFVASNVGSVCPKSAKGPEYRVKSAQ